MIYALQVLSVGWPPTWESDSDRGNGRSLGMCTNFMIGGSGICGTL